MQNNFIPSKFSFTKIKEMIKNGEIDNLYVPNHKRSTTIYERTPLARLPLSFSFSDLPIVSRVFEIELYKFMEGAKDGINDTNKKYNEIEYKDFILKMECMFYIIWFSIDFFDFKESILVNFSMDTKEKEWIFEAESELDYLYRVAYWMAKSPIPDKISLMNFLNIRRFIDCINYSYTKKEDLFLIINGKFLENTKIKENTASLMEKLTKRFGRLELESRNNLFFVSFPFNKDHPNKFGAVMPNNKLLVIPPKSGLGNIINLVLNYSLATEFNSIEKFKTEEELFRRIAQYTKEI